MQKKLLLSYLLVIMVAIGITTITFWLKGYAYINKQSESYYLMQAELLEDALSEELMEQEFDLQKFVDEYSQRYEVRLTIIDRLGTVCADSSIGSEIENHATREEVVQALKGEKVSLSRYSKTMGQEYSYSAVPIQNKAFDGVLRVSLPLSELTTLDHNLQVSIMVSIVICLLVAACIAILLTKKLLAPIDEVTRAAEKISNGDFGIKIYTRDKEQIGRLASSFNVMSENLRDSVLKLTRRNVELEAMLSSMTSGVVSIDNENKVLFYNNAFLTTIQLKEEEVVTKNLYTIIRNAAIFEAIDAVHKTHETQVREGNLEIEEKEILIRITATPLSMSEETVLGVLLIIEDITQIKKLENMRRDFVSNVTHELKTPLTSIRGFIDTLKNGALKDETVAYHFLDIVDIEAERLYGLIQDILLLSEIESKREYEVTWTQIDDCVQDVVNLLEPKRKPEVKLIYKPEPYVSSYYCNIDRMKQLLINLLDNGMKYTEAGSVTIVCKQEEDFLIIRVTDTGIGIQQEHLERIFERFYRVDKGRSRKQGGTGLGLSIVKHIVELYNGTIRVESEEGKGTMFEVRFPY